MPVQLNNLLNLNFAGMQEMKESAILTENESLFSINLKRGVIIDLYYPRKSFDPSTVSLLLINDGQDMDVLGLERILESLYNKEMIRPLFIVAIHAGAERKMEYGMASTPDYKGRGAKAAQYTDFIMQELIPYISEKYGLKTFSDFGYAGFSLGGLSALDIAWNHPSVFNRVGVFSGSLWWRSVDQSDEEYSDDRHRIMHQQIRLGKFRPGMKFYFQCGNKDETRDRNKNGIIDSIEDTRDLVTELAVKGYERDKEVIYVELENGRHDVPTWGLAMPGFLKWGYPRHPTPNPPKGGK